MHRLRRFRRAVLCLFVACQVYSVVSQVTVSGLTGEDVRLPCKYRFNLPANTNIYWHNPNDSLVQKVTLREEQKGNFSIVLRNAQPSHSGKYQCSIPSVSYRGSIHLNISAGSRVGARSGSPEAAPPPPRLLCLLLPLLLL